MADLVIPDARQYVRILFDDRLRVVCQFFPPQGVRMFNGPDGLQYRWRPSPSGSDTLVGI